MSGDMELHDSMILSNGGFAAVDCGRYCGAIVTFRLKDRRPRRKPLVTT